MIIRSKEALPTAFRLLEAAEIPASGLEITWGPAKQPRSLSQNALSHVWYAQIADTLKDYSAEGYKRLCKYRIGVPILRQDPDMSEMIDKILGHLSYEDRIAAMDFLNVSSVMTKAQMSHYLEDIQNHFAGRVELEF